MKKIILIITAVTAVVSTQLSSSAAILAGAKNLPVFNTSTAVNTPISLSVAETSDLVATSQYSYDTASTAAMILTGDEAIMCIEATGFKLHSKRERYMPVKVEDGFHVYIQTRMPEGDYKDVAAFSVTCLGGATERRF